MATAINTVANIRLWRMIESKARLAICSIEYAEFSGKDAFDLSYTKLVELQNQLGIAECEMAAQKTSDAAKVNIYPGKDLSLGK